MENMVNVYFFGKKYSVPADLTIMTAICGLYTEKRMRMPPWFLWSLCDNLQDQGKK